jgi:hypothetical protein
LASNNSGVTAGLRGELNTWSVPFLRFSKPFFGDNNSGQTCRLERFTFALTILAAMFCRECFALKVEDKDAKEIAV